MEREVSESLSIGVTLAAIATLLSVVMFTVYVGNTIKATGGSSLSGISNEISFNYIDSLARGEMDNEMPTATAYNIFKTYDKAIIESADWYTGEITNLMEGDSSLRSHLNGRVQLELLRVDNGAFIALVHNGNCTWKSGTCTCRLRDGAPSEVPLAKDTTFKTLKAKYKLP
jgi:hypothetical protein